MMRHLCVLFFLTFGACSFLIGAENPTPASSLRFFSFFPGMGEKDFLVIIKKHGELQKNLKRKWNIVKSSAFQRFDCDVEGKEFFEGIKSCPLKKIVLSIKSQWPGEFLDPMEGRFLGQITLTSIAYPDPRTDKGLHQWLSSSVIALAKKTGVMPTYLHEGEYNVPIHGSMRHAEWKLPEYDIRVHESSAMNTATKNREFYITITVVSKREIPRPKIQKDLK